MQEHIRDVFSHAHAPESGRCGCHLVETSRFGKESANLAGYRRCVQPAFDADTSCPGALKPSGVRLLMVVRDVGGGDEEARFAQGAKLGERAAPGATQHQRCGGEGIAHAVLVGSNHEIRRHSSGEGAVARRNLVEIAGSGEVEDGVGAPRVGGAGQSDIVDGCGAERSSDHQEHRLARGKCILPAFTREDLWIDGTPDREHLRFPLQASARFLVGEQNQATHPCAQLVRQTGRDVAFVDCDGYSQGPGCENRGRHHVAADAQHQGCAVAPQQGTGCGHGTQQTPGKAEPGEDAGARELRSIHGRKRVAAFGSHAPFKPCAIPVVANVVTACAERIAHGEGRVDMPARAAPGKNDRVLHAGM